MTSSSEAKIQALETKIVELEARGLPPDAQVRALKNRIWRVAMVYKEHNRWCEEYDRLLKAAGVAPNLKTIVVETRVPAALCVEVNADDFDQLTPEEQQAFLAENLTYRQGNMDSSSLKVQPVRSVEARPVEVLSYEVPAPTPAQRGIPDGYDRMYTSQDGRVAHYVRIRRGGGHGSVALCGAGSVYAQWATTAPRAELNDDGSTKVCARCTQRARNL